MVELIRKVQKNNVNMVITNSSRENRDIITIKFSKRLTRKYYSERQNKIDINVDELEASGSSFEQVAMGWLDIFIQEIDKEIYMSMPDEQRKVLEEAIDIYER